VVSPRPGSSDWQQVTRKGAAHEMRHAQEEVRRVTVGAQSPQVRPGRGVGLISQDMATRSTGRRLGSIVATVDAFTGVSTRPR